MSNDKIQAVGVNIAEKATMIWNVADMLRGPFKPHEYGLVILPMTVVKRFHDCLLPTHEAVLAQYEKVKKLAVIDGFLTKASGYQFYNTSKFTFEKLLADPDNIEANFRDYLAGFSPNVQDVLSKFDKSFRPFYKSVYISMTADSRHFAYFSSYLHSLTKQLHLHSTFQ